MPFAGLLQARNGMLYGATKEGGTDIYGTIFQITTEGALKTLQSFDGTDGYYPHGGLMQAGDGNLYGTTYGIYNGSLGTVFQITTEGKLTTLHSFTGCSDGANPYAVLIQAGNGNLYGTTPSGGVASSGAVFQITPQGTLKLLHSFSKPSSTYTNSDGDDPLAGLIQSSDGNLYGTCWGGGANSWGTVFKITTGGTLTTLYSFNYFPDGAEPGGSLIQANDGDLYGTTSFGGEYGSGTVFRITTGGTLTTLYSFSATSKSYPYTNSDGANPLAGLIQGSDGNLYGTTVYGGTNGYGTVFRITTSGTLTTLYTFSALSSSNTNSDGALPYAGLIQARDGNLYGTCVGGGTAGDGTVFSLNIHPPTLTSIRHDEVPSPHPDVRRFARQVCADFWYLHIRHDEVPSPHPDVRRFARQVCADFWYLHISPISANAAGPAFTLTLKGSLFTTNSTVEWTGAGATTPLTTTYVTSSLLKADVPAPLIANAGTATVNVANLGGEVSNAQTFTILTTTLKLVSASLTKTSTGSYTAKISLQNSGYLTAPDVTITQATLGAAATATTLPLSLGSIANGKTGTITLSFPSTAGSSGSKVSLKVSGTFTDGNIAGSVTVKLP